MGYKHPSVGVDVKDSNGLAFEGQSLSATANSEWMSLDDSTYVGVAVAIGTVTGTSPTCDIAAECRFGGSADVYNFPIAVNDGTQAALAQLTTSNTNLIEYWVNPLPSVGENGQIRFTVTLGGTTPVFPIDQFVLFKVDRG